MRQNEKRTVTGRIDTDSHESAVQPGNYRHALNFLNLRKSEYGAGINAAGNELIPFPGTAFAGATTVVGAVEDKPGQSIIYFIASSAFDHAILQYLSDEANVAGTAKGRIVELARGEYLNFSSARRIQARVAGRELVWTDALGDFNDISGNEVRRLNIDKARLDSKYLTYEVYTDIDGRTQFVDGTEYTVFTTDLDGLNPSEEFVYTASGNENSIDGLVALWEALTDDPDISDRMDVEQCDGCKLSIRSLEAERRVVLRQGPGGGGVVTLTVDDCAYGDPDTFLLFTISSTILDFAIISVQFMNFGVWIDAVDFGAGQFSVTTGEPTPLQIKVTSVDAYNYVLESIFTLSWATPSDPCGSLTVGDPVSQVTNGHIILVPINHYHEDLASEHITLIKQPPECPPTTEFFSDEQYIGSNVTRSCFQFRSRFVYRDGDRSAWSAISMLALPIGVNGEVVESMNAIMVDFTDLKLDDPVWLGLIESVEIAVRDGNDSPFYIAKRLPVCEVGRNMNGAGSEEEAGGNTFVFTNSEIYSIAESDDLSIPSSGQVLKLFDWIPPVAQAIELIADEEGNTRIAIGGMEEMRECPDCVNVNFDVTQDTNSDLVTIVGRVEIINHSLYPADNPNFLRYPLGGFAVYLAGTRYYGISNNPEDGSGDGSFEIRDVPKGVYVMRVTGYTTSFAPEVPGFFLPEFTLQTPRECLTNGLEWQRTSAPVIDCAGSLVATGIAEERVIDLTDATDTFDLDTEPGYGTIQIQNMHSSQNGVSIIEVYMIDSGQDLDATTATEDELRSALQGGIAVERFRVTFPIEPAGTENKYTDHNGYAWIMTEVQALRDIGSTGIDDMILFVPSTQEWGYPFTYNDSLPIAGTNSVSGVFNVPIDKDIPTNFFIFLNRTEAWTDTYRKTLSGSVVGANGSGVSGALIVYTRNGRQERTDVFGNYTIAIYPPNGGSADPRDDDDVIVTYENDISHLYPPTPGHSQTPSIDPWDDHTADPFTFPFNGGLTSVMRYYKAGAAYNVGIVYEDDAGRSCGVSPAGIARVPFFTEIGKIVPQRITYEITSIPPVWATRYRFVRSKNTIYQNFYPWATQEVKFGIITKPTLEPVFVEFSANNWTHMFIQVNLADADNTESGLLLFFQDMVSGYTPTVGDRLRFVTDTDIIPVTLSGLIDIDVAGKFLKDDNYYIVIPRIELPAEPGKGWLFEFYTPNTVADELYYETGDCLKILFPGTALAAHEGSLTNQDITLGSPATGILSGGDTYWRFKTYAIDENNGSTWFVEHKTISRFHRYPCEDIGRAWVYDPGAWEKYHKTRIRFGGIYSPRGGRSNLSSFGSLDYRSINIEYGQIKCMVMVKDTMLVICAFKSQPIYVGKARVTDMSKAELIGRSSQVLNIANELVHDAGTLNPESVVVQDGNAYFWDVYRGCVWRFGQDGMNPIDAGMVNYFRARGKERIRVARNEDFVPAGFDRRYGLYILTFPFDEYYVADDDQRHDTLTGTWAYDTAPGETGWKTEFSFQPDFYAMLGNRLFTLVGTGLWEHDTEGAFRCNFYGEDNLFTLSLPFNSLAAAIKTPFSIRVYGRGECLVRSVEIQPSVSYPLGMFSLIPANRFVKREGAQWAPFLRDWADPSFDNNTVALLRGRLLKYNTMVVMLEAVNSQALVSFVEADVEFALSMDTKS